ncbi:TetR/AcrR family transcriptional regulator [Nocardioides aurantiacus]|uniref:TetR family transcriptional regulator n=1 Tax=Nocardioides aurantiacus TaxID=86796 RepID=A0A3N2CWG3_9ACTN|nr:TetR/AcrR family transcriptional regulator [Nocardioides aurantiacus]ROR91895.1 TetR family transcriptional regulator [Nocardioides aurantiacus]
MTSPSTGPSTGPSTSAAAGRRGRPGYDRETVLRRAVELFNERGYDATSTADLARELGVSKSAIFHHVSSKEELLASALDEALTALDAAVDAAGDAPAATTGGTSATERLRATVAESVRILVDHLPAVTLLLRVRGNSPVEQAALERRRVIDEKLARLVRDAADEGTLRTDLSSELISRLVFGTVNSLVEWYRPDGTLSPDDLAAQVTALAFDGLSTRD